MSNRLYTRAMSAVIILLLTTALPGNTSALKDVRRQPITRAELTREIRQTPLDSPTQLRDLLRASHSGLLDVAYALYTQTWQAKQQDASANLLRGVAAELYWDASMDPTRRRHYGLNTSRQDLFAVAQDCLRQAAAAPHSAEADMEWGYFLWQFGDQEAQGLALLEKAVVLQPSSPRVHATLGLVYSNQSGNAYSLSKATTELVRAAQLDPSYAYPHILLSGIYALEGETAMADKQRRIYLSLLP